MKLLKLVPDNTNIRFLRWRVPFYAVSVVLMAALIALLFTKGLNLGVDFVGGQMIRMTFVESSEALLAELGVTKEALLADTALLTTVLTYHVVPARVLKAEVPINTAIATVQGQTFTVNASLVITDQNLRISNITMADVFTSNGVIHVVDKVILPK